MSERALDRLVHEITDRVWAAIDCTRCWRCCREISPSFSEKDQKALSPRLNLSTQEFRDKYLVQDQDGGKPIWILKEPLCPFLNGNECSVYADRPSECRGYPYLHKREFSFRLIGMIERTFTCPVVFEVMEELKKEMGFRYR